MNFPIAQILNFVEKEVNIFLFVCYTTCITIMLEKFFQTKAIEEWVVN